MLTFWSSRLIVVACRDDEDEINPEVKVIREKVRRQANNARERSVMWREIKYSLMSCIPNLIVVFTWPVVIMYSACLNMRLLTDTRLWNTASTGVCLVGYEYAILMRPSRSLVVCVRCIPSLTNLRQSSLYFKKLLTLLHNLSSKFEVCQLDSYSTSTREKHTNWTIDCVRFISYMRLIWFRV